MPHSYSPLQNKTSQWASDADTEDEASMLEKGTLTRRKSPCLAPIHAAFGLIVLVAVSLLVPPWAKRIVSSTIARPGQSSLTCGNSSTEALEAGCQFDTMSFTWSQPACFDQELMDNFLARDNWTWCYDAECKQPAPQQEVERGQHDNLFVTWEYHLVHCTYMWRKMHRAILDDRPLDSYVGSFNHTLHCEKDVIES